MASLLRQFGKNLDLRKLGSLPGVVDNRDARLVEIFEQWFPDCYESDSSGKVIMSPKEEADLEELFELYGLNIKVKDNTFNALLRVYDVVGPYGLSFQMDNFMTFTDQELRRRYETWPPIWIEYMTAVARANKDNARELAKQIQVLSPDCVFPYGVFIKKRVFPADN
ncbi:hypothetical protein LC612_38340 [Nostoc sp. CHAB 5834]|nr:hypothetical protein [Nostoc sp. CHAB 5834]